MSIDSKASEAELTRDLRNAIGDNFSNFDKSADGGLDFKEFVALVKVLRQAKNKEGE